MFWPCPGGTKGGSATLPRVQTHGKQHVACATLERPRLSDELRLGRGAVNARNIARLSRLATTVTRAGQQTAWAAKMSHAGSFWLLLYSPHPLDESSLS